MNYTQNHHLPQWEKSDRILMDDFNQAMSRIETGLNGAGNGAAEAAAKAQSTADSALAKANAAQTTANNAYNPSYKPYVSGSYTGNGSTTSLYLGFKPSFLILTGQFVASTGINNIAVIGPQGNMSDCIKLTSTGMEISNPDDSATISAAGMQPHMNRAGQTYGFIAFR